jgi:hypothetical protein
MSFSMFQKAIHASFDLIKVSIPKKNMYPPNQRDTIADEVVESACLFRSFAGGCNGLV